jgi:formylglycine-generating enzyme required for sulfatase activity
MSLVPEGMLSEGVTLENLLNELAQQREYEVQIQQEIDSQVAYLREAASLHWQKVRGFAQQRVDDPARVAVYAFLREYQNVIIHVQGKEYDVDIPEVQLARQLLTRLATPTIEGVDFTWIPADNFVMGNSDKKSFEHPVRLNHSFYASTTEVTQQLYQFILNENPSAFQGTLFPVTNVSWFDAVRFSNALSSFEGLEERYTIKGETVTFPLGTDCLGYRLPTEAEWEYAARGNGKGGFSGGDRISRLGWVDINSGEEVHFVKQKVANTFGLFDMSGNVSEWVWDWYEPYDPANASDPIGPVEGIYRVQRGGSAMTNISAARVDARYPVQPAYVSPSQGFRIVRTVPDI